MLALRDMPWIINRSTLWDGIGVISYTLFIAFLESITLTLLAILAIHMLPKNWGKDRLIASVALLACIIMLWGMEGQAFFLFEQRVPAVLIDLFARCDHPLRILYTIISFIVLVSIIIALAAARYSFTFLKMIQTTGEALAVLMAIYLTIDVLGIIILIIRNVT